MPIPHNSTFRTTCATLSVHCGFAAVEYYWFGIIKAYEPTTVYARSLNL